MQRLHPDAVDRWREPARLGDDLANERDPERLDVAPGGVVGGLGQALGERGAHDLARLGRLLRREAVDVLRHAPELLVGDELILNGILERWHWCAVETGAETGVDRVDRIAAAEFPILREISRANRIPVVVFQRR